MFEEFDAWALGSAPPGNGPGPVPPPSRGVRPVTLQERFNAILSQYGTPQPGSGPQSQTTYRFPQGNAPADITRRNNAITDFITSAAGQEGGLDSNAADVLDILMNSQGGPGAQTFQSYMRQRPGMFSGQSATDRAIAAITQAINRRLPGTINVAPTIMDDLLGRDINIRTLPPDLIARLRGNPPLPR